LLLIFLGFKHDEKLIKHLHHLPIKDYRDERSAFALASADKEKSSPDKSDELLIFYRRYFEAINLTYLSRTFIVSIGIDI